MKKLKLNAISFYGKEMEVTEPAAGWSETDEIIFEVTKSFDLSSTRAEGLDKITEELTDDDLLEITFDDGTVWLGPIEDIQQIVQPQIEGLTAELHVLDLPPVISVEEGTRSLGSLLPKILRVFRKKSKIPERTMKFLAEKYENKTLENKEGLYWITRDFELEKFKRSDAASKQVLLFIHGTATSVKGSFDKLANTNNSEVWNMLHAEYDNRIAGFQHRTLTHSPFQNVYDLLKELPNQISLDLVSQSRGGLVGELFVRFVEDKSGISNLFLSDSELPEKDRELIPKILDLIETKEITINRFVRVACPGGGTSLMGKRVEFMFNALLNLIHLAFSTTVVGPVVSTLKELIVLAVKEKDNPESLPGLEAMNPRSSFVSLINSPYQNRDMPQESLSQLLIIAGSKSSSFGLKSLTVILSRLVFKGKNDLIVNTASMYYAAVRQKYPYYYTHYSKEVHHFGYFSNTITQQALRKALLENIEELPEFQIQDENWVNEEVRALVPGGEVSSDTFSGKKDVVILLPGIMGSTLAKNNKRIWLDFFRIIGGKLHQLKLNPDDGITTSGLIKTAYGKLIKHLKGENYDVITFAFDWRRGIPESGEKLIAKVEEIYNKLREINRQRGTDFQVSIMAHSMGGLVAREIAIQNATLWNNLNTQSRFRLMLLGTPWLGSYRIPYVLSSRDKLIKKLKLLDRDLKKESRLLNIFSKYHGLLHLLPIGENSQNDFADTEEWKDFIDLLDYKFEIPGDNLLNIYGDFKKHVEDHLDKIDYSNIVYIAGRHDKTPCLYYSLNNNLVFENTVRGDESVTWDGGIPKGINRAENLYFVEATHGDLSCKQTLFSGLTEILSKGSTYDTQFRRTEAGRGIPVAKSETFIDVEEDSFSMGEAGLYSDVLGISFDEEVETHLPPLRISVLNADLKMSSAPLIIGHFSRDGILRAEAAADTYLDNSITNKYRLGVYPEAENTHEIFLNPDSSPFSFKGAIIVGLGEVEKFTSQTLINSVEKAMITYMLESSAQETLKVSTLLVGSNYGQLSPDTSIRSILLGIQRANAKVSSLNPGMNLIEEVELVEIYKDKSIAAFLFIDELIQQNYEELALQWSERRILTRFGNRSRLVMENQGDWWQRVSIASDYNESNGQLKLKFSSSTAGAREERQSVSLNLELFREILESIANKRNWNSEDAQLIYEMLIPNPFKENISNRNNVLFILDPYSAALPWELLQSGEGRNKPLCVNSGMVRQLSTRHYSPSPLLSKSNSALIIGDPDLEGAKFAAQLPSARKEAEKVKTILGTKISDAEMLSNQGPLKLIRELTKSKCKILHIAAHGVFNPEDKMRSGIIIGKQNFGDTERAAIINEDFIGQLSNIPELVFINTCYSGTIELPGANPGKNRVELAANLGIKWIAKGAKAVVITGWEVMDAAALTFAEVFYECMVKGLDFATSVKNARSKVFANYPDSNTWGAYQCYGDPFYKFSFSESKSEFSTAPYVLKEEVVYALDNLNSKIEIDYHSEAELSAELENIKERLEKSMFDDEEKFKSGIYERLGNVCANLNRDKEALQIFERIFASQIAGFGIDTAERYFAIKNKLVVNEFLKLDLEKKAGKTRAIELKEELKTLEKDLQGLTRTNKIHRFYIQLGNIQKSLALVENDKAKRIRFIKKSIQTYSEVNYPAKNLSVFQATYHRLILKSIENIFESKQNSRTTLKKDMEQFEEQFAEYFSTGIKPFNEEEDYWNGLRNVNVLLARAFYDWEDLTWRERNQRKNELIQGYQSVFKYNFTLFRKEVEWKYLDICIRFIQDSEYSDKEHLTGFLKAVRKGI